MQANYKIDFAEELKKCTRCGTCRFHCPVFLEVGSEPSSPRAKMALLSMLQQGKIKPSHELADKIYTCLLCKTCTVNCGSGVFGDKIILGARNYLEEVMGEHFVKKVIFKGFLTRPALLQSSFSLAKLYQKTGLHSVLTRSNLINFLPEKVGSAAKIMPDVSKKPANKQLPRVQPAQGERKFRVAYFLGCASNLIYPEVPVSAVRVLSKNGCEVVIPEVKCCGFPSLAYGDTDTTVDLAKSNLKILLDLDVDAVISDCATCTSTLSSEVYGRLFEEGTSEHEQIKLLNEKVYDLNKFLIEKTGIAEGEKPIENIVTYHDPCHLKRAQSISSEPRELLKAIPGLEFKEMREADRCCGSAGSFSFMKHDLSMKILDRKIESAMETGANYIATSCPSCNMQLNHGVRRNKQTTKIIHPVQLLAKSYNF